MNRRDALKVIGGVATIPVVGLTVGAVQNKSLPVAQYRREVGEDTWYKRTSTERTRFTVPVTCQRIVRELVNTDEIMGMEYEYVGNNSTFADEGPVCRLTKFMRRHGKCWINKEDAEYLLHPKTMKPIRVWGEVEMAETLILTKSGVMGNKGVFDTGRTVGMTEKTQWEERKWVFDHTVSKDKYHFTVHREDCKPERMGDVQELFYKIDYHDGKGNRSTIYSLCGPVKDGKWKTEWNEKEQALMTNIVASVEGH